MELTTFSKRKFRLFLIVLFAILSPVQSYEPLKQLVERLFSNYEAGIRPNYGETPQKPVKVGITLYVLSVENIDPRNMEFTTTIYLRQSWNDPRLKFDKQARIGIKGSNDSIVIDSSKENMIWVPDTFIVNEKTSFVHQMTVKNEFVKIMSNGDVLKSQRVTLTAHCLMDLTFFPMDSQICTIELESYGFTMSDIYYFWSQGRIASAGISPDARTLEFQIIGHRLHEHTVSLSTGNYSRIAYQLQFLRAHGKYVSRFYVPLTMFVSISLMALWLLKPELGALICFINVGFINLFMAMGDDMKLVSYRTALDRYVMICLYYIYACLIVSLFNLNFACKKKSQSELIEMQQRNSIRGDDTQNLFENQNNRLPLHNVSSTVSRWISQGHPYWSIFKRIFEVICRHISWILPILFIISVLIYWANLMYDSSKTPEDLILLDRP